MKAEDVTQAASISLATNGHLDLDQMQKLLGRDMETITTELAKKGIAFNDPKDGWVPAQQYLSGNVRKKLYEAREAALTDEQYKANVEALEKAQPEDVGYDQIHVRLGASWVEPADMNDFAASLMGGNPEDFRVSYIDTSGQWLVNYSQRGNNRHSGSTADTQLYGTSRAPFMTVFQNALDGRQIRIYDTVENRRIYNEDESNAANAKIKDVKDKFTEWIWTEDERRARLHRVYNDTMNNLRHAPFEGSHLTVDADHSVLRGMDPSIKLREHQISAVWRTVSQGVALYNHEVGTGKTFTMVAAAMELRRMGLANKPAIAALKDNIEDITASARRLYPGIKLISIENQFDQKSRRKTISKVATGDYDLVILTHDNLNQLPMSSASRKIPAT